MIWEAGSTWIDRYNTCFDNPVDSVQSLIQEYCVHMCMYMYTVLIVLFFVVGGGGKGRGFVFGIGKKILQFIREEEPQFFIICMLYKCVF